MRFTRRDFLTTLAASSAATLLPRPLWAQSSQPPPVETDPRWQQVRSLYKDVPRWLQDGKFGIYAHSTANHEEYAKNYLPKSFCVFGVFRGSSDSPFRI
jgi:outer membrane biogenesis lipoprotein LolB